MINFSIKGIEEIRQQLGNIPVDKALRSTLRKVAAKGKTAVSKEIRKTYNLKARDLNKQLRINTLNISRNEVVLTASGSRFSLIYFDPKEIAISGDSAILTSRATGKNGSGGLVSKKVKRGKKRRGVTVKVRKDRGRKRVKGKHGRGGFIAQARQGLLSDGSAQIFERIKKSRLPLRKLEGPASAQLLSNKQDTFYKLVGTDSQRIFNKELDFFIGKALARV